MNPLPFFKPMLSGTVADVTALAYPLLASPKLDGIRATVQGGVVLSRNLKPIRNAAAQAAFGHPAYEGLDGELIVGAPSAPDCFLRTSSGVMSAAGDPEATFHVFDQFSAADPHATFKARWEHLVKALRYHTPRVRVVPHVEVRNAKALLAYETQLLEDGYEGVMLRSPAGPYKQGRATLREGYLLKLKVFEYDNAIVVDVEEAQENTNTDLRDALGHAKRSTAKAGMRPKGTLGGLTVVMLEGPFKGKRTQCGPGNLTAAERQQWWDDRAIVLGRKISVKYFQRGSKDLPRFPLYNGPAVKKEGI